MDKHDLLFWLAVAGATAVKVITTFTGVWPAFCTVFAAVFSAYFGTAPALDMLGLDPEIYTTAMAALMALTGEGIMRYLISVSADPSKMFDLLRLWRGGK